MIASMVMMKRTLTTNAARSPSSGGNSTPNVQLSEIGPNTANSQGHHGNRPSGGATSAGKIMIARRTNGSMTSDAAKKTTAQT
jgi:hypothetical protein